MYLYGCVSLLAPERNLCVYVFVCFGVGGNGKGGRGASTNFKKVGVGGGVGKQHRESLEPPYQLCKETSKISHPFITKPTPPFLV